MAKRLVLAGHGMVGQRLLEEVVRRAPGRFAIDVIGAEPQPAYNRILLSPVIAGEAQPSELALQEPGWFSDHGITLHPGTTATEIDRAGKHVITSEGQVIPYDALVLATGSTAIRLPLPGSSLPGVVTFRDMHDAETLLAAAEKGGSAVVIGGGLLGLEAASGLRRRGMAVTVVHRLDTLMERQLDLDASRTLQATLEGQGLAFRMAAQVQEIEGTERVTHVRLADGTRLGADLVVMAVGVRPRADLGASAGLTCAVGILVDDSLRTADASIFAIGECAQHRGRVYGLVAPLYEQAAVCARQLAGDYAAAYLGSLESTTLKVSGVGVASIGQCGQDSAGEPLTFRDPDEGHYRKLLVTNGRLTGAILVGDTQDAAWFGRLIARRAPVDDMREALIFGQAAAEALLPPPEVLPAPLAAIPVAISPAASAPA